MALISPGKVMLTLTSFWTAYSGYHFDWNETHIYNPEWPRHAKFHNAQTMSTGAALGTIGLFTLWGRRGRWTRGRLDLATGAASLYWITQLSATLYPGTALFDHPRPARRRKAGKNGEKPEERLVGPPRVLGPQTANAGVVLAVNALAYVLERRRFAPRE